MQLPPVKYDVGSGATTAKHELTTTANKTAWWTQAALMRIVGAKPLGNVLLAQFRRAPTTERVVLAMYTYLRASCVFMLKKN